MAKGYGPAAGLRRRRVVQQRGRALARSVGKPLGFLVVSLLFSVLFTVIIISVTLAPESSLWGVEVFESGAVPCHSARDKHKGTISLMTYIN